MDWQTRKDGVLALLDVFHELDGGSEALLDVVANVAVGGVASEKAAVGGAEAKLGHVVFVQEDLPLVVDLAEIDVGLDEARLGFVVAQARAGIELLDDFERAFDDFEGTIQRACDFLQLIGLHLLQMFGDNLLGQGVLRIESFELEEQTFAQVACADADGIEILDYGESVIEIVLSIFAALDELLGRGRQVAVFIEVADDAFGEFLDGFGADGHAQLPAKVVGQAAGRGKELFEGGPLGNFSFLGLAAVAAGIEIFVEKAADVEFVERIGFRFFRQLLRFGFQKIFVAVVVRLGGLFAELFEDGVGDHLLVDHLAEFEAIERQDADHLDEAGRQNLPLRHS